MSKNDLFEKNMDKFTDYFRNIIKIRDEQELKCGSIIETKKKVTLDEVVELLTVDSYGPAHAFSSTYGNESHFLVVNARYLASTIKAKLAAKTGRELDAMYSTYSSADCKKHYIDMIQYKQGTEPAETEDAVTVTINYATKKDN